MNVSNPCIRCGKERIDGKTYTKEFKTLLEKSVITYTQTVCPDKKCQKEVEAKLELQRQKTESLLQAKEERLRKIQASRKRN